MTPEAMDEVEITLAIRKEMEASKSARTDPNADPSLFAPWGILGPQDYAEGREFKSNKPN
jgi:hypothetical protein